MHVPAGKKANALAKSTSKAQGKAAEAASGIANMKINDAPPPKSKGLDVLKEFEASKGKRSVSFVVVGKHLHTLNYIELCRLRLLRSRRCWEKHSHGTTAARAQVCRRTNS